MALELEHTWEHALVAATIKAAKEKCPECSLGRIAVQKLVYFLKVMDVPMNYKFDVHHYGPYCQDIASDIEWLIADNIVIDDGHTLPGNSSSYKTASEFETLSLQFSEKLKGYQPVINSICEALSDLSPKTLELVATLDFSFRWVKASGGDGPWKTEAVAKFKKIKKDKFNDDEIDRWYGALVKAKLIEQ